MKLLLAILPALALTLYGQIIAKWRVGQVVEQVSGLSPVGRIIRYLLDPVIASAYLAALLASVSWFLVLERYELSVAYPIFVGLVFGSTILGSVIVLGEPLTATKLLSIALILAGVVIGAR